MFLSALTHQAVCGNPISDYISSTFINTALALASSYIHGLKCATCGDSCAPSKDLLCQLVSLSPKTLLRNPVAGQAILRSFLDIIPKALHFWYYPCPSENAPSKDIAGLRANMLERGSTAIGYLRSVACFVATNVSILRGCDVLRQYKFSVERIGFVGVATMMGTLGSAQHPMPYYDQDGVLHIIGINMQEEHIEDALAFVKSIYPTCVAIQDMQPMLTVIKNYCDRGVGLSKNNLLVTETASVPNNMRFSETKKPNHWFGEPEFDDSETDQNLIVSTLPGFVVGPDGGFYIHRYLGFTLKRHHRHLLSIQRIRRIIASAANISVDLVLPAAILHTDEPKPVTHCLVAAARGLVQGSPRTRMVERDTLHGVYTLDGVKRVKTD
jgi:hypothetical protein